MKAFFSTFAAILCAGMCLFYFVQWRSAKQSEARAQWLFDVRNFTEEVNSVAALRPVPGTSQRLDGLLRSGESLAASRPSGAFDGSLAQSLYVLKGVSASVATINWQEVGAWTIKAKAVAASLQRAANGEPTWLQDRSNVINSARKDVDQLLKSAPHGADLSLIDGAMKDMRRAIETIR